MRRRHRITSKFFSSFIGVCTICLLCWTVFGIAYVYADEASSIISYSYEDADMYVLAEADKEVLPEGASFHVDQIKKTSTSPAQSVDFHEAVAKVEQTGQDIVDARVYDIYFMVGDERIEPTGNVNISISYKDRHDLLTAESEGDLGLAHISSSGDVETLDSDITLTDQGQIKAVDFVSDEFSVYVVFNKDNAKVVDEFESLGDLGRIKFRGYKYKDGKFSSKSSYPRIYPEEEMNKRREDSYKRKYFQVIMREVDESGDIIHEVVLDDYLYTKYYWLGIPEMQVGENYQFSSAKVYSYESLDDHEAKLVTEYTSLDDLLGNPIEGCYVGRHKTAHVTKLVIDVSHKKDTQRPEERVKYYIRHHHMDGDTSVYEGFLENGQIYQVLPEPNSDEEFCGVTILAGHSLITDLDEASGKALITGNIKGSKLAKLDLYYKDKRLGDEANQPQGPFDAEGYDEQRCYKTDEVGLYTDKYAVVSQDQDEGSGKGRTFDLVLQSWYVDEVSAHVGMILDASGSMAWASTPQKPIAKTAKEWKSYKTDRDGYLTEEAVNQILNPQWTDNSKMGYGGYRYYVFNPCGTISEYAPLGYSEGSKEKNKNYFFKNNCYTGRGWYYVNTAGVDPYKENSAKRYEGFHQDKQYYNSKGKKVKVDRHAATKFYVDKKTNQLMCRFSYPNKSVETVWDSYVYLKNPADYSKAEALQHAIGTFTQVLSSHSSKSNMGMVKFSAKEGFSSKDLLILDWTKDTTKVIAALNQNHGDIAKDAGRAHNSAGEYNYGLTGGTATFTGLDAFESQLHQDTKVENYIIIFTDGKDNSKQMDKAIEKARYLKSDKGGNYTVIPVLMQSAGMDEQDVASAKEFLGTLASKPQYLQTVRFDDVGGMEKIFQNIANTIGKHLEGYTVRDYIDPRFDLLDEEGNNLTKTQGVAKRKVVLDHKDAWLIWDENTSMYYLQWENQSIPSVEKGASTVKPWTAQITVRAKDDFLGANDVLTNGNVDGENKVFKPGFENNDSVDELWPAKDFPLTSVNPQVIPMADGEKFSVQVNEGDTIFSKESIEKLKTSLAQANPFYGKEIERLGEAEIAKLIKGQTVSLPYCCHQGTSSHKKDEMGTIDFTLTTSYSKIGGQELGNLKDKTQIEAEANREYDFVLNMSYQPYDEQTREEKMKSTVLAGQKDIKRPPVGAVQKPVGAVSSDKIICIGTLPSAGTHGVIPFVIIGLAGICLASALFQTLTRDTD